MSLRTNIANLLVSGAKTLMGNVGESADTSFLVNQLFGSNYAETKRLGKYRGIVFAAVNLISDEVSKYQPVFNKQQADGHLEPIKTHPLLDLFAHPSRQTSQADFFKAIAVYTNMIGESFWYIPLGELTRKPNIAKGTEIYLLPPDKMGIKIDDQGEIIGYVLRKANGQEILFKPEEIKHHKTFNPNNPYRGYGIVEAAIDYIETEEGARQFTRNFFKNNGVPAGIISIKNNITQENFRIFAQRWREQYEGTKNAGKTAIIRGSDVEFTKTSLGLGDIDMAVLKDLTVSEVLRMFRVPKALLGEETNQGFGRASVETLEYIFAKRTIEPQMEMLDNSIQELLSRYYPAEQLTVSHENIVPEDKEFELKERQAAVDVWLTRNEVRQEEGLDDEPGGDQLRAPVMSVPIGEPDVETPNESVDSEDGDPTKAAKGKTVVTITRTVKKKTLDIAIKESFRLSLQKKQRAYERRFSDALDPVLLEQKKEVIKKWNTISTSALKAPQHNLIDLREAEKAFENALLPIELALADDQGQLALEFAGASDMEFELTPEVQKFIKDAIWKMADRFNEESIRSISTIITDGLQAGKSAKEIAKDLGGFYDNDTRGYRAERLSRTETLRASNEATRMAYKQTGYVVRMEWFANPGACGYCEELNGTTVGLDEEFAGLGDDINVPDLPSLTIDYTAIETPPLHPNCECTIIPIRE